MNNFIQTMILITLSSVPLMVSYLLKRRHKKSMQQLETEDEYYHQSLFINMKNFSCKQHLIDRKECGDYCSYTHLETLLKFISSAKISICLCMYTFTLKQINMELIRAHKNGIKIRIITDRVMAQTDISKFNISKLKEIGIPCKVQQSYQSMMHHKFCVIDKEDRDSAKMFFGSLNLTCQGLVSNFDSIILTNNWNIIEKFSETFEELWQSFQLI